MIVIVLIVHCASWKHSQVSNIQNIIDHKNIGDALYTLIMTVDGRPLEHSKHEFQQR